MLHNQTPESEHEADLALARRAAAGSPSARCQIAERLFGRVCRTIRFLAGANRDADDLVQMALMEILRSLDNYRGDGRLEAWADRITVRTARRLLFRWRRHDQLVSLADLSQRVAIQPAAPRNQLREQLEQLLQKLPRKKREVVVLRWAYQYSVEEIAGIVGVPVNTVRDRLRTGRTTLRRWIVHNPILREYLASGGIP